MGQFALDITKWVNEIIEQDGTLDQAVRSIMFEMSSRVVQRSPVDTGRFKANWQLKIGSMPEKVYPKRFDKSGRETLGQIEKAASRVVAGDIVYLINNVPYSIKLEDGHSKQAAAGVIKVTVEEFGGIAKDAAAKNWHK